MKHRILSLLVVSLALVSGCAHRGSDVVIDPKGVDMYTYQQDLAECTELAEQVRQKAGEGAVKGAVVGGLIGAVVGNQRSVEKAAGVGAVAGGAKGASTTSKEKLQVIKNCLRNRGYQVLN